MDLKLSPSEGYVTVFSVDEQSDVVADDGCAYLLDFALVQHHEAISQVHDFVVVMRDENRGQGPALVTLAQPAVQLLAPVRVERAEGFVEQENARHDG